MNAVRTYSLEAIALTAIHATVVGKLIRIGEMRKPQLCTKVETVDVEEVDDGVNGPGTHIALRFHFESRLPVESEIDSLISIFPRVKGITR